MHSLFLLNTIEIMPQNKGHYLTTLLLFLAIIIGTSSCNLHSSNKNPEAGYDLDSIKSRGELRVLTLSSSTSYFIYKGEERGYEYELAKRLADDLGVELKIIVAHNMSQLTEMLLDSVGDLIAFDIPITGDTKTTLLHCGPERINAQVVVQSDKDPISDVVELVGKDVYVERGSKYEERINNLNKELGGGINIHCINRDTIVTEDLIEMVSKGEIPFTLADETLARRNRTYYNNIDIYLPVSFPQRSQWAVRNDTPLLAQAIDEWTERNKDTEEIKAISQRYFESSKRHSSSTILSIAQGRISEYDEIFKSEAAKIGWDWRLLASIAYHESRFDPSVISWAGARGIMQLMPATAAAFGLGMDSIALPAPNVEAAVKSIKSLENSLQRINDQSERLKFIIAAYNCGIGHVFDALALADKYGKNTQLWYGEVEEAMLMKGNPAYFNDEVCRYGYFGGRQTTTYVREVMSLYDYYCEKIPK